MNRFLRVPVRSLPPGEFEWDRCLENRRQNLQRALAARAPEYILEICCRNVLRALARKHKTRGVIWRWIKHDVRQWWHHLKFDTQWNWYTKVLRHSQDEAEQHFFGDSYQDPEESELRKMAGLEKKS